jgi:predicted site-specific integrase-resolvase
LKRARPDTYKSTKEARRILNVRFSTLKSWHEKGWIDAIRLDSGHFRWDVEGYITRRRAVYQPKIPANQPQG